MPVVIGAVGLIYDRRIMELIGTPPDVIENAIAYARIIFMTLPVTKGPSNATPNQLPNWVASLTAPHTRSSGARRTTLFWMRSVSVDMSNLPVAHHVMPVETKCNPWVAQLGQNLTPTWACSERAPWS